MTFKGGVPTYRQQQLVNNRPPAQEGARTLGGRYAEERRGLKLWSWGVDSEQQPAPPAAEPHYKKRLWWLGGGGQVQIRGS